MQFASLFARSSIALGVCILFLFPGFAKADIIWTPYTNLGTKFFQSVAMSADGMRIIASAQTAVVQSGGAIQGDPGYLYLSTDGGSSWSPITNALSRVWTLVTSSANGMHLAAVAYNGSTGYVITSDNGGATWTDRQVSGYRDWRALSYSRDGSTLVGAAFNDGLFLSNDHGATWRQIVTGSHYWTGIAVSSDGHTIAATAENDSIHISHDGGATWTLVETARNWRGITMSANGNILAATESGAFNSKIYISKDSGTTWTPAPTKSDLSGWRQIISSADGTTFVATNYYTQYAYASTDGGTLWYELTGTTAPRPDGAIALNDAGNKIILVGTNNNPASSDYLVSRSIYAGTLSPFTPPTPVAPVLSQIRAESISAYAATLAWDSDIPATSQVTYGTTSSYGFQTDEDASLVINHATYLSGLSCDTTYHYAVSSGAEGMYATSSDMTFETLPCPEPIDIMDVGVTNITITAATLTWKTPIKSDTAVNYGETSEYGETFYLDNFTKKHSARITGLVCGKTYHYSVSSSAGESTGSSPDATFETLPCPTPTISDLAVLNIGKKAATIFWKTAAPADSTVLYGTTTSYGQSKYKDSLQKQRNVQLTGLVCGTTYHFKTLSTSEFDITSQSDDATFSTLACN